MQAGMHHIAVNVFVHNHYNNIRLRISCVFMFVYNGLNTLCEVFILHLLRKASGCCMHVFSSTRVSENIASAKLSSILFMSWTVFDVMRMRENKICL
jgi:hypothetical protein